MIHRLITTQNTRRLLFYIYGVFVYKNSEAEAKRSSAESAHALSLSLSCNSTLPARNSFGLCLRVIVNQKPLNLEMTTSSVLSVLLLIYGLLYNRSVCLLYNLLCSGLKIGRVFQMN